MKLLRTISLLLFLACEFNLSRSNLDVLPFGRLTSRLPDGETQTRDRSRYRHRYPISPLIRTAGNNQSFAPVLWDLAPQSYPIDFFLYTKDNPDLAEEINVDNVSDSTYFDKSKPTKIIIHDFMQSTANPLVFELKDAYMNKKKDHNVILVDWEPARTYTYTVAVTVSEYVGKMTARLIQAMKIDPKNVHVIGFGLGAHASGVMGSDLKIHYNMTLSRITGLDPSLPLFRLTGDYYRLDREDASFVDVIHTDGGDNLWNSNHLGMGKEMGHVDIYPNRGIFQPGCRPSNLPSYDALMCSHTRALEIYKESIEDELSFVACRCPTWTEFTENRCDCMNNANRIFAGEACSPSAIRGNYYLVTNEAPPYGMGGKGTVPIFTRAADPGILMQGLFNPINGSLIQGISQLTHVFTAPLKPFFNTLVRNAASINAAVGNSNHNNDNAARNPFNALLQQLNQNNIENAGKNPFNGLLQQLNQNNNNNNPGRNPFSGLLQQLNLNNNALRNNIPSAMPFPNNQFNNDNNNNVPVNEDDNHNSVRDTHLLTPPPPPALFQQDSFINDDEDFVRYNPTPEAMPPAPPQFNFQSPPNY